MAVYMQVPYATGSVTAEKYKTWIKLDGIQFDVSKATSAEVGDLTAIGDGVPRFSAVTVYKETDDSSSGLMNEVVHGQTGHTIIIAIAETGESPKEYTRYTLYEAMISYFGVSGGSEGKTAETLTFHYSKVEMKFTPHDPANKGGGNSMVAWDLKK